VEKIDREMIERSLDSNFELRKLYQEHKELEDKLKALGHKHFLTEKEQQEELTLKQRKLRGVEKMLVLARRQADLE
jgi:hypothetical protein